jgi:hypothetical protein
MKPEVLSRRALNRALLARQMLLAREQIDAASAVARLAGMQAQQAQPPFIGLWTRIEGFEPEGLLGPLRRRKIVRATLMRGTLHLMTAVDYLSLRGPLQPALSAGMRSVLRDRAKDLDIPALVAAARRYFAEQPRTFTELRTHLIDLFPTTDARAMGYAVRTHLPLVAAADDSQWGFPTDPKFAEAESWLGQPPDTDEQPDMLVLRYLAAFGPATAADVQTWSALSGVRDVLDRLRPKLQSFRDERKRELFDLPEAPRPSEETPTPARFLPGFDNVILAHDDRSRIIADEHRPVVTTRNLQVLPTFLVDGFVAGTWKTARVKSIATLTISPFKAMPAKAKAELGEEGEQLIRVLEPEAEQQRLVFAKR